MKENKMDFMDITLPAILGAVAVLVLSAKSCELITSRSSVFMASIRVFAPVITAYVVGIVAEYNFGSPKDKIPIIGEVICVAVAGILLICESRSNGQDYSILFQIPAEIATWIAAFCNGAHLFSPLFHALVNKVNDSDDCDSDTANPDTTPNNPNKPERHPVEQSGPDGH